MPIRAGINALYLIPGGVGGTEIYLRQLLNALAETDSVNSYFVLTNRETSDLVPNAQNIHRLPQNVAARNRPARILWEQLVLPAVAAKHHFDVLLNPGFTGPAICPCPQVTVFHDLQHKRHPEYFRWFDLPFWNALLYLSAHRSRNLIAVSEPTRTDLLHFYGVNATVVPHGVESAVFALAGQRSPEPFFLCVSTLHPHKGIQDLLGGFAEFRREHPQFRLVLAGMPGFAAPSISSRISQLALTDHVELTGWIPREHIYALYRRAFALIAPSKFEGFGMPVAEAMAAGVPVACSRIPPHEWVADDAALFFDPGDERQIATSLSRLATDTELREQLVAAGRARAQRFTWETAAALTREVLERSAGQATSATGITGSRSPK